MANNTLLTFKDWVKGHPSVPFRDRQESYETYIKEHSLVVITENVAVRNELKASYIAYLKRLSVFYKGDPEIKQLENLDFDDPIQLAGAIPIFAKKLKDVAIFAKRKREELKHKKLEFSTKGSELGLENSLRNFIVDDYSTEDGYTNPNINDVGILNNLKDRKVLEQELEIVFSEKFNIS